MPFMHTHSEGPVPHQPKHSRDQQVEDVTSVGCGVNPAPLPQLPSGTPQLNFIIIWAGRRSWVHFFLVFYFLP